MKRKPLQAPAKAKRNSPCPCGSGRKAKKCCMFNDALARAQVMQMRREFLELDDAELARRLSFLVSTVAEKINA